MTPQSIWIMTSPYNTKLMILSNQQTNDLFIDEDFVNTNNVRKDGLANLESTARNIENHKDIHKTIFI